jgi:hypothetical protein
METLRVHPEKLIVILALVGLIATESLVLLRLNRIHDNVALAGFDIIDQALRKQKAKKIAALPLLPLGEAEIGSLSPPPFGAPHPPQPFCEWLKGYKLSCGPERADQDSDGDGWTNFSEWTFQTSPIDADAYPTPDRFIVLEKVIREEFPLRFMGRARSQDGQVAFQINVRDLEYTYLIPVGRQIASGQRREMFGVENFEEVLEQRFDPTLNASLTVDRSRLTLRNLVDGSTIVLTMGEIAYAAELKLILRDLLDNKSIPVKPGDMLPIRNQRYRIGPVTKDEVQLSDDSNRTVTIGHSLREK